MDETLTPNNGDAWALSRLGYAIDVLVDRKLNDPQAIYDSSQAYGIDGEGRLVVELPAGGRTSLDAGEVHLR